MKKLIFISIIILGFVLVVFQSCDKKHVIGTNLYLDGLSYIKVGQFSPSFRQIFGNRPDSINIYANGVKINGPLITFGSIYPTITNLYAGVPSGTQSIRLTVNGLTTPDSITLGTFTKTLDLGAYYSFIITDSVLSNTESQQMWIKDNFALTDTGRFTLRFIHAILNDTLGKTVDVFSTRYASNIFTNISPGTISTFNNFAYTTLADTLIVRRAGTLFELGRLNGASFSRTRAYTILYKGQPATIYNATSAPKGRNLIQYTNL